MNAALSFPIKLPTSEELREDLYYWDAVQRRHIWTARHLELFLENASAPVEPVVIAPDAPTITCYVTSWEALL